MPRFVYPLLGALVALVAVAAGLALYTYFAGPGYFVDRWTVELASMSPPSGESTITPDGIIYVRLGGGDWVLAKSAGNCQGDRFDALVAVGSDGRAMSRTDVCLHDDRGAFSTLTSFEATNLAQFRELFATDDLAWY